MFRKDFKLEMLAQYEESRKAELAVNRKPSPGRKNGRRTWTGLSATMRRSRQRLSSLPPYWNGKLKHRPGRFPM